MAGVNQSVKKDQLLFSKDDPADGMFVVRKGELSVFLTKDGHAVELAKIGPGGMIGEMAFFDKQPRSASVKASQDSEVTKITTQDFEQLVKQIPKWFVAIMGSLSARLRETNERLQKLENQRAGAKSPFEDVIRILNVSQMLMKNATKDGKYWVLPFKDSLNEVAQVLAIDLKKVENLFQVLIKVGFATIVLDTYKVEQISLATKNQFLLFANFLSAYVAHFKKAEPLPIEAIEILRFLTKATASAAMRIL